MNKSTSKIIIIAALALAALGTLGVWTMLGSMNNQRRAGELLADYGAVPDVQLVERSGRALSLGELKGNIWVADFIFTNCGGTCPMMTAKMSELQKSLKDAENVKLVSFSVDPKRDQPEKLKSYAEGFQADKDKWLFLTGSEQQMQDLAKKSFLLTVEEGTDPKEPIIHSQRFVLVDAEGHIRGYYNSGENEAKQKMLTDIGILLREME
jgi:protein SCO1/2